MPIKMQDLNKKALPAVFTYEGETCTVYYRPAKLTTRVQFAAAAMATVGREGQTAADQAALIVEVLGDYTEALTGLLASWDVLGEDGKPIPITVDVIQELPLNFVYAMFTAIQQANSPNAESAKT